MIRKVILFLLLFKVSLASAQRLDYFYKVKDSKIKIIFQKIQGQPIVTIGDSVYFLIETLESQEFDSICKHHFKVLDQFGNTYKLSLTFEAPHYLNELVLTKDKLIIKYPIKNEENLLES